MGAIAFNILLIVCWHALKWTEKLPSSASPRQWPEKKKIEITLLTVSACHKTAFLLGKSSIFWLLFPPSSINL